VNQLPVEILMVREIRKERVVHLRRLRSSVFMGMYENGQGRFS
jgi:hypothetical protein